MWGFPGAYAACVRLRVAESYVRLMRKRNDPRPKTMRIDDAIWGEFIEGCKAEGKYPRRVLESLMMNYRAMSEPQKARLMRAWAAWWKKRK